MSDPSPSFPLAAPPFTGESRVVPASRAFDWLQLGWALFVADAGIWVAIAVIFFALWTVSLFIPMVGVLVFSLLSPVFCAGILGGCRRLEEGGQMQVGDLFAAFSENPRELISAGVLVMVASLAIMAIGFVIGGGAIFGGLAMNRPAGIGFALGGMLISLLVQLTLLTPLMMAFWFAPPLIAFHQMKAMPALKASFAACARNWLVFTVYGIVVLLLSFFALLPVGLGMLVLLPVLFGSLYASYRDIFVGA